jgi:hypothetical protein
MGSSTSTASPAPEKSRPAKGAPSDEQGKSTPQPPPSAPRALSQSTAAPNESLQSTKLAMERLVLGTFIRELYSFHCQYSKARSGETSSWRSQERRLFTYLCRPDKERWISPCYGDTSPHIQRSTERQFDFASKYVPSKTISNRLPHSRCLEPS